VLVASVFSALANARAPKNFSYFAFVKKIQELNPSKTYFQKLIFTICPLDTTDEEITSMHMT
jgi:hypothetical protein